MVFYCRRIKQQSISFITLLRMALLQKQRSYFFVCMVGLIKIGPEELIDSREQFLIDVEKRRYGYGVLLSTCNRVEWYHGQGEVPSEIARHLFRVVSGLESSIIGETAIVNQVKTAYEDASRQIGLNKSLHKLFQTALFVGKKVRTKTGISNGAMSHSQVVVDILLQKQVKLDGLVITIVGVNKMNEKIIRFLTDKGASAIFIGNRTYEKAAALAARYDSKALKFEHLGETLQKTDVLISATSAPHFVIKKENFPSNKSMLIFDLAVPRDVDPDVTNLGSVDYYNIETIEREVRKNVEIREERVFHAEDIINRELEIFLNNQANGRYRKNN